MSAEQVATPTYCIELEYMLLGHLSHVCEGVGVREKNITPLQQRGRYQLLTDPTVTHVLCPQDPWKATDSLKKGYTKHFITYLQ